VLFGHQLSSLSALLLFFNVLYSMRKFKFFAFIVSLPMLSYYVSRQRRDASGGRMVFALNARDHHDDMVLASNLSTVPLPLPC
jgi:hypothetical protein